MRQLLLGLGRVLQRWTRKRLALSNPINWRRTRHKRSLLRPGDLRHLAHVRSAEWLLLIHQTRLRELRLKRIDVWRRLRRALHLHLGLSHHHILRLRRAWLHHLTQIACTEVVGHTWLRDHLRTLSTDDVILLLGLHLHCLLELVCQLRKWRLLVLHCLILLLLPVRRLVAASCHRLDVARAKLRLACPVIRRHGILTGIEKKLHVHFALVWNHGPLLWKTKM